MLFSSPWRTLAWQQFTILIIYKLSYKLSTLISHTVEIFELILFLSLPLVIPSCDDSPRLHLNQDNAQAAEYCLHTSSSSTVQYSTVQHSTVQYSTVQYSTVQHSTSAALPPAPACGRGSSSPSPARPPPPAPRPRSCSSNLHSSNYNLL